MKLIRLCLALSAFTFLLQQPLFGAVDAPIEYKMLATNKTSTMEKEMNEAAKAGFRFDSTMGGETTGGGNEIVVIMARRAGEKNNFEYKLLATNKTSTMQKELNGVGAESFKYVGQTIYNSTFGGREVITITERDAASPAKAKYTYKLQATKLTSTMQKELNTVGADGYTLCGITVAETLLGGREIVAILRKQLE